MSSILKSPKFWVSTGIAAAALTWVAARSRAHAAQSPVEAGNISSIFLIGDSQTKRHLGESFKEVFSDQDVSYFGKEGATHEDYLGPLAHVIDDMSCADVIYVQLGDNGISAREQAIYEFINKVKSRCPGATIYWGGPMKAVPPTQRSSYVNTDDPSSPRFIDTYNQMRQVWNSRIRDALDGTDVTFIDNYALQESQPISSPFGDRRAGDGIHLAKESATALAEILRPIILPGR